MVEVVVLALTGCGGGSGSSTGRVQPIYAELRQLPAPEGEKEPLRRLTSLSRASVGFARDGGPVPGKDWEPFPPYSPSFPETVFPDSGAVG